MRDHPALARWHGPAPSLPEVGERALERWFGLPPRLRALIAGAAGLLVLLGAGAGAARSPWGPPVAAVVTLVDVPAGATLDPSQLTTEDRPADLVPDDAVSLAEVAGRRVASAVVAGTVLTSRHLAGDGGLAAGLAPGRAAYPAPTDALAEVEPGQRVDVVAGDVEGRGRTLARGARVLAVADGVVWLDVARDDAPGLAAASTWDGLRIVLLPP